MNSRGFRVDGTYLLRACRMSSICLSCGKRPVPATSKVRPSSTTSTKTGGGEGRERGKLVQFAILVPEAPCNGPNTESCSDNLSIMRTVESSLATAVNRCVGRICNLAETRAPRSVREGQPEAQALSNASKLEVFCLVQNATGRGVRHRLTHGWQGEWR